MLGFGAGVRRRTGALPPHHSRLPLPPSNSLAFDFTKSRDQLCFRIGLLLGARRSGYGSVSPRTEPGLSQLSLSDAGRRSAGLGRAAAPKASLGAAGGG